ncbi:unnamed protein product, partial [Urochloa humidicola]
GIWPSLAPEQATSPTIRSRRIGRVDGPDQVRCSHFAKRPSYFTSINPRSTTPPASVPASARLPPPPPLRPCPRHGDSQGDAPIAPTRRSSQHAHYTCHYVHADPHSEERALRSPSRAAAGQLWPLAASSPCLLRVPRSLRRRRPRSLKASALLEQGIKEVAGCLSPSGKSSQATRRDVRNIAISCPLLSNGITCQGWVAKEIRGRY